MYQIVLTEQEIINIQQLIGNLCLRYNSVEDESFLCNATVFAHDLPSRLRFFLNDFKRIEPTNNGVCLVSGYPIDQVKIGPTPRHWKEKPVPSPALAEEIFLTLCGSLLGDIFGWSTQQEGYIMHNVLPIQGHEKEQLGSNSEELLTWHTEDAFHPYRGDFLGLFCMRNPYQASTTYVCIDQIQLEHKFRDILFEPRFILRPDLSHLPTNRSDRANNLASDSKLQERAYQKTMQLNKYPPKIAVFFGDESAPYMRLDPYYMDRLSDDAEAQEAFDMLVQTIDEHIASLILQPGDLCFIDNYRAVHGRNPFKAQYDGNDRWLKRVNITRDLRKSRELRSSVSSSIIF